MMLVIFAVFVCCLNFAWCYCYLLACGFSLGWFVRAVYVEQIPTFCHPWHKHLSPSYHLLGGFVYQPGYRRMLVANGVSAAQTANCLVSYLNQPLRRVRRWIRMLMGSICLWKMLAQRICCIFYHSHFLHVPWAPGRSHVRVPDVWEDVVWSLSSCNARGRVLKCCVFLFFILFLEITLSAKPHPPVVGKVTHHSIELYWDLEKKARRQGPQEQWFRFSVEEEDPKMHTYGIIYT